jgi:hypothetical protein
MVIDYQEVHASNVSIITVLNAHKPLIYALDAFLDIGLMVPVVSNATILIALNVLNRQVSVLNANWVID